MTLLYEYFAKPALFHFDPESVHDRFTRFGSALGKSFTARKIISAIYNYQNPILRQTIAGITFENPIGLAAGFDKECYLMEILPSIGFGYEEVGSITAEACAGNPRPRLARLPKDQSIIVYYGLKNQGAVEAGRKLSGKKFDIPVGVSIAKTNKAFRDDGEKLDDWIKGIKALKDMGSYCTINISCPNTSDLANFCDPKLLEKLIQRIEEEKVEFKKPVFFKLTADLSEKQADEIIRLCYPKPWITGFVLSNLIKDRSKLRLKSPKEEHELYKGGLSGRVVQEFSLNLVRNFRKKSGDRFVIIGCGGIFTTEDAYEYIKAGANLLQLITGMIYQGPGTIKQINKGLAKLIAKDGYSGISEAVGKT